MSTYLSAELRRQLLEADDHRCAYCQTTQFNSGYPMVVDHIVPQSNDGPTEFENLCFACHRCNEFKGATTEMEDPLTGEIVPLFHPRQQQWRDHFTWDAAGIRIVGLTAVGRVCQYAPVNVPPIRTNNVPLTCTNNAPPICGHNAPPRWRLAGRLSAK